MYIKYVTLLSTLFFCTASEIFNTPFEIQYRRLDSLNVVLHFINIPERSLIEYRIKSVIPTGAELKVERHGKMEHANFSVELQRVISTNQNYSVELKADGVLYTSKDIFYLIENDFNGRESHNHECLDRDNPCVVNIDCGKGPKNTGRIAVLAEGPRGYEMLSTNISKEIREKTIYFNVNETFKFVCRQDTNRDSYTLAWNQYFPRKNIFQVDQEFKNDNNYVLKLTLGNFDDETNVTCSDRGNNTSTKFIFKLNTTKAQTASDINIIYFDKQTPITHRCGKDHKVMSRNENGYFTLYGTNSTQVFINQSKSILFCIKYKKQWSSHKKNPLEFIATRYIYNETTYISNNIMELTAGTEEVVTWVSTMIAVIIVLATGAIAYALYRRTRTRAEPTPPQENIYESIPEVVYAEIDLAPCASDKPIEPSDKQHYAKIIGILGPKN